MKGTPKSHGGLGDSLNESLRAPRREGTNFDYLLSADDHKRDLNSKKFDYVDADQNRLASQDAWHSHASAPDGGTGVNSNPTPGRCGDHDSEDDDDAWIAEQLAIQLPAILNPKDEPLEAARMANVGPIGLLGFGMTTILLNLVNTGHWQLSTVVPAMGICYGGGAQFIAGLLEFVKGNTFGFVAFTAYGAFWASLVCVWMLPVAELQGPPVVHAASGYFSGMYLIIWGLFSTMMLICTLRMNVAIFLVFLTVSLLFFLLGGGDMAGKPNVVKAGGYEGIVCGGLAMYLACAEVLNEVYDRTILPIIPMAQVVALFRGRPGSKKAAAGKGKKERVEDMS